MDSNAFPNRPIGDLWDAGEDPSPICMALLSLWCPPGALRPPHGELHESRDVWSRSPLNAQDQGGAQ